MATQTIKQSAEAGGRFRLTPLVTMATFIGSVLQVFRRKLNSVAVTRARREENNVMCAASAKPQRRESTPEVINRNEPSLDEILEIVRISQEVQPVAESYEHRHRRVIDSREFCDELRIVRYTR